MEYTHAKCLKNVSDDFALYNIKGKIYEITQLLENDGVRIESEYYDLDNTVTEIETTLDDEDFQFIVLED